MHGAPPDQEKKWYLDVIRTIHPTGLGGRDLGYPAPWDISLRSDKAGQNVYGPSLATVETTVVEPLVRPKYMPECP